MSEPIIRVEGLSKRYRIGARQYERTLREAVMDLAAGPLRRIRSFGRSSDREEDSIWALKDVSFNVQRGEVLGIIGPNGAGKTTLLKILSRITEPTEGRAIIKGRVASLLEVGTGFHQELTGRENIYLSGAILGMSKKEIEGKLDEIVEFSGVEKFMDTPVKRFSSGMRVRLGFAVAAHLDPDILLVDEVLAVGDAEFQKKCLARMNEVAQGGRTVLFVSHNMAAVQNLCKRALLLHNGRLTADGDIGNVVREYLAGDSQQSPRVDLQDSRARTRDSTKVFQRLWLLDSNYLPATSFFTGEDIHIALELHCTEPIRNAMVGIGFHSVTGQRVTTIGSFQGGKLPPLEGRCFVLCTIPNNRFAPGEYSMHIELARAGNVRVDRLENVGGFSVQPCDLYGTGWMSNPQQGVFLCDSRFRVGKVLERLLSK